ncbi:MAG: GNAT family N-acetyltransferase [Candidatus Thorarchaeota archaeon]
MEIRRFQSGDEVYIAQIYNESFSDWIEVLGSKYEYFFITPPEVGTWLSNGSSGFHSIWVAEVDENVVGFTHCFLHSEHGDREVPLLRIVPNDWNMGQSRIAVLRNQRRKGIASALLRHSEDFAKEKGAEFIIVVTFSDNKPAEQLLTKLGYIHKDFYYFTPYSQSKDFIQDAIFAHFDLLKSIPLVRTNYDVTIRHAAIKDVDELQTLSKRSATWIVPEFFTKKWIRDYILGLFGHTILIAELDNQIVGAMDFIDIRCRIGVPGVLPEHRRKGIGYTLFHALLKEMKSKGLDEAIADSGLGRTEAIQMYERFGFEIRRRHHSWFKKIK